MKIKNKIQVLADNLMRVTQQKFVAIRNGDHKQARNLHGIQLELDLKIHELEKKAQASSSNLVC